MPKRLERVSLKPLPQTGGGHRKDLPIGRPSSRNDLAIRNTENRLDEHALKAWNKSFEEEITDHDPSIDDSEYQSESGMSLSDLNSLGFESSVAIGISAGSLLSDAVPRSNADNYGAIGGLLKGPYIRALSLISKFMESNSSMTSKASATRKLASTAYAQLYAQCREMFILALKRDMLSRLAALYLVVEKIPRLVEAGDYATMLSELKLHARHISDLQALHAHFLTLLPSLTLPSLASAEARFLHEIRGAADVAAAALSRRIEALAGVTPLPEAQVSRPQHESIAPA
jgi:hypothetical protein